MDEQEFAGSYAAHVDFTLGVLWLDYSREIQAWLESVRSQLEIEQDINAISRLQGVAEACRRFLALPSAIIELLQLRMEERNDG